MSHSVPVVLKIDQARPTTPIPAETTMISVPAALRGF
jgi:hypothetical protein